MKRNWRGGLAAVIAAQLTVCTLSADETNTIEMIKQLQKRIEGLEQKVKSLEPTKAAPPSEGTKQNEERDQWMKTQARNRELEIDASETKAMELPKLSV